MTDETRELRHSVAFRVTEKEWKELRAQAEKTRMTVPQMAKQALFEKAGIEYKTQKRRYGHYS